MKKGLPIIIILFIAFQQPAHTQPQKGQAFIDSLLSELPKAKEDTNKVNLLNALGYASLDINEYDAMFKYSDTALALSEKLNFKRGQGDAYNIIGISYSNKGAYQQSLNNHKMALKVREETGDKKGMAGTYNNMGIIYASQGNTPEALNMFYAAVKINEAMDNKAWLAINYANLGNIFQGQGNYSEALKMAFAALKINEALRDKKSIAGGYNNIGILYWTQKNYTEALNIYSKALKIMEEIGDKNGMNDPYNNMAGIYTDMGNYPEALKNYAISLKIREQMGDKGLIADSYANFGTVYQRMHNNTDALNKLHAALKIYQEIGSNNRLVSSYFSIGEVNVALKNFTEARDYFNKGLALLKEAGNPGEFYYTYEDLAKLDSATGNYKSALANYKQYILHRDSAVNQENSNKLIQTQMQYDFDKKEAVGKAEQEKKDVLALKNLQRQKLVRNGFMAGFTVVLLFAGVFFTQRNKIKKEKKRSDELLLNILPAEVAEELKTTGATTAKDFSEVTVLFTDFKNFTTMSEKLSAQGLVNEINYCYSAFDKIITKYGIEKIKTIGDSYMCAGGLPVANKTNAEDTVRAALKIRDFMLNEKEKRETEGKP
ncbi:MAG: tetratricopeptide repeat protein, partial [Ginsengibacter sp.]